MDRNSVQEIMIVTVPNCGLVAGGLITVTVQISMVGLNIIVQLLVMVEALFWPHEKILIIFISSQR